VVINESYLTFI